MKIDFRKKTALVTGILFFVFAIPAVQAGDKVDNFQVKAVINKNGDVDITEEFVYDYGDDKRHGIYRYIPTYYNRQGNQYTNRITDIKVTDNNGQPMVFSTTHKDRNLQIIIGDENKTVTGGKVYKIQYKIKRAFNFFNKEADFFWNITGNNWSLPITQTVYTVTLPEPVGKNEFTSECLFGAIGDMKDCLSSRYIFDSPDKVSGAVFIAENIPAGGSMTTAIKMSEKSIKKPTVWKNIVFLLQDNIWWVFVVLVLSITLLVGKIRKKRNLK